MNGKMKMIGFVLVFFGSERAEPFCSQIKEKPNRRNNVVKLRVNIHICIPKLSSYA